MSQTLRANTQHLGSNTVSGRWLPPSGWDQNHNEVYVHASESVCDSSVCKGVVELMQTYESLTWTEVTSFLGPKLLRLQERSAALSGSTATRLQLSRATIVVIVTEPDISPIFLHHIPTSSTRRLRLPHIKSLKEANDPPGFVVIFERTSPPLAQAACPVCHGPEILSAGQSILSSLLGGGVRRRIA